MSDDLSKNRTHLRNFSNLPSGHALSFPPFFFFILVSAVGNIFLGSNVKNQVPDKGSDDVSAIDTVSNSCVLGCATTPALASYPICDSLL